MWEGFTSNCAVLGASEKPLHCFISNITDGFGPVTEGVRWKEATRDIAPNLTRRIIRFVLVVIHSPSNIRASNSRYRHYNPLWHICQNMVGEVWRSVKGLIKLTVLTA